MLDHTIAAHHAFSDEFNTFLLKITDPMIAFLQGKTSREALVAALRSLCLSSACCNVSLHNESVNERQRKVLDFVQQRSAVLENCMDLSYSVYADKDKNEYQQKFDIAFKDYVVELLHYVEPLNFDELAMNSDSPPDFKADYTITVDNLLSGVIDLPAAEASLLCWQGAIPSNALQNTLLHMRYRFIKQLFDKYTF